MEKTDFVKNQLKDKLLEMLPKQGRSDNDQKHRTFLIDCIEEYGYIKPRPVVSEPITRFEKPVFKPVSAEIEEETYDPYQEYHDISNQPRYQQNAQQNLQQNNLKESERLKKLQQRGITQRETDLGNFSETIDTALNKIYQNYKNIDVQKIKTFALNLYNKVLDYYIDNAFGFKSNSHTIKKGYIALIVWYSLLQFNINIPQDKLVTYFENIQFAYLHEPDKYLHRIFTNLPKPVNNLCGMKQMLLDKFGQELIDKIYKILGHFGDGPNYVAGGIYYFKDLDKKMITLDFLKSRCDVSPNTISKASKEIEEFLKRRPGFL
jgi:hypothetical protein